MATTIDGILNKIAELERRLRESGNSEEVLNELEIIKAMLKDGYNASLGDAFSAKTIGPAIATGVEILKPSRVIELVQETGESTELIMSQNAVTEALGEISNGMGDLSLLTTTAKDNLVNAINELNDKEVDLTTDATPTQNSVNLVTSGGVYSAISDTKKEIGDLTTLQTTAKNSLVNAINETNENIIQNAKIKNVYFNGEEQVISENGALNIVLDTQEITALEIDRAPTENSLNLVTSGGVYSAISGKTGDLTTLETTAKDNLVNAINEVKNSAGGSSGLELLWAGSVYSTNNAVLMQNFNISSGRKYLMEFYYDDGKKTSYFVLVKPNNTTIDAPLIVQYLSTIFMFRVAMSNSGSGCSITISPIASISNGAISNLGNQPIYIKSVYAVN